MLRKITVNMNVITALSLFPLVIFDRDWLGETIPGGWEWIIPFALINTVITCFYLQIARFEKESYQEKSRR